MLGMLGMIGNYGQRKVSRFEKGEIVVDTCLVTDSDQPYETALSHPSYNDGAWVIVELYETKDKAKYGHDKWVKIITAKKLPKELEDVSSCFIAKLLSDRKKLFKNDLPH